MDYAVALALAQRLINENGRDVVLQQLSATAIDSAKPWKGPGTPTVATSFNVTGVFLPASGNEFGKTFVDAELLKRCEQLVLIAGHASDLTAAHQMIDGGTVWRVQWVRELKPADVTVLYAFGVKR